MAQRITGAGVNRPGDFPADKIALQNGFRGMRRRQMLDFIAPFVKSGAIPAVSENTSRDILLPMLEQFEAQGYFGDDPWGKAPSDDHALAEVAKVNKRMDGFEDTQSRILSLLENQVGAKAEGVGKAEDTPPTPQAPEADPPPSADTDEPEATGDPDLAALARPAPVDLAALHYRELQKLGTQAGLHVVGVSREKLEAALAPIMEKARLET